VVLPIVIFYNLCAGLVIYIP